jgi:hypothetical protein
MPPNRRAARDDDDDDDDDSESLVLQERLDDQTVLKSEGGDLVTFKAPQRCPSQSNRFIVTLTLPLKS